MTVDLGGDEVFSSAVAGLAKVAALIGSFSCEDRRRALEAIGKSYLETARGLGYQEADAAEWAKAVMLRLRLTQPIIAA
jgi:ABC-type arginine transport system permease subunit